MRYLAHIPSSDSHVTNYMVWLAHRALQVKPLCCETASLRGLRSQSIAPYSLSLLEAAEVLA